MAGNSFQSPPPYPKASAPTYPKEAAPPYPKETAPPYPMMPRWFNIVIISRLMSRLIGECLVIYLIVIFDFAK